LVQADVSVSMAELQQPMVLIRRFLLAELLYLMLLVVDLVVVLVEALQVLLVVLVVVEVAIIHQQAQELELQVKDLQAVV
jgi:uncharacterized membrane protein YhhN